MVHISSRYDLQKGTEHVTFPVNTFSSFQDELCWLACIDGTKKVSELSVSISNTLFASVTTFLSTIASSSFCFHSARACADSA